GRRVLLVDFDPQGALSAAALAALGRERAAHEEFERAATLARELPYPAGAFAVDEAGGTDWTARSAPPD
ncbi:hypothetical protein AB0P40_20105, partial [Streptomyces sp. NPDC079189]|uniref:hypothetical protein n=1 Tax=Streptomyces sp. NPDC079189 TaxID=3154514 RepID=UPI00344254ED